ncbi:MAG: hypothetical protein UU67_C0071G0001, partial [Candidatus Daviesbacteria bacterium GW2011_GWB1_41_5]
MTNTTLSPLSQNIGEAKRQQQPPRVLFDLEGNLEADANATAAEIEAFLATGSIIFSSPIVNEGPVNISKASEESPWMTITSEGFKIASSLLGETIKFAPDIKDAVGGIISEATGIGLAKPQEKDPGKEAKTKAETAFARRTIAALEEGRKRVTQEEFAQRAQDAIRNEVNPDDVGNLLGLAHMDKSAVLTKANILQAALVKGERQKAAEKTKKGQSLASVTKKGASNALRM